MRFQAVLPTLSLLVASTILTAANASALEQPTDSRTLETRREAGGSSWSTAFGPPPGGNGTSSSVNAVLEFGGNLIVGGDFVDAGNVQGYRVASWDGAAWSALGSHGVPFRVFALAEFSGELIAAGYPVAGYNMMRWDGANWIAIPGGPTGAIAVMQVLGGSLFVGGDFGVRTWNGTTWSIPGGDINGNVTALTIHMGNLYAGGVFQSVGIGSIEANYLARWSGSAWVAMRDGTNNSVTALASRNDSLFVGGQFSAVAIDDTTFVQSPGLALWIGGGGGTWDQTLAFGAAVDGSVHSLLATGTQLVVAGEFSTVDVVPANNVATWDSGTWSALSSGVGGSAAAPRVHTAIDYLGDLYVGGTFQTAGGSASNYIARWSPLPPIPTAVSTITPDGLDLFSLRARQNPVTQSVAVFEFTGPTDVPIQYSVHDVRGRRLWQATGFGSRIEWDTRNGAGRRVPSGTYFVSAQRGSRATSASFVVLR